MNESNEKKTDGRSDFSLADKVTNQIRDWILTGTYRPGEKLPPERRLASLLGVNRGSLRLALKKLEQFGLLQSKQGDGTRVRDLQRAAGIELLPFLFQTALSHQPEMLRDILELRVLVCSHLVRKAARKAPPIHLSRVRTLIDAMERTSDPVELLKLDFDMYWEYARGGSSIVGQLLLNTVRGPFERHSAPFLALADDPQFVIAAAREVLDAVSRGDAEAAGKRAEEYLKAGSDKALEE